MPAAESTTLSIRMPAKLRRRLRQIAAKQERTESAFVRYHLSQLLEKPAAASPRKSA
jgi:predicted transcriptional regulator